MKMKGGVYWMCSVVGLCSFSTVSGSVGRSGSVLEFGGCRELTLRNIHVKNARPTVEANNVIIK